MKPSTKDNAEGKMHQAKGKIKETVGKIVGNDDLEAEGKVENLARKSSGKDRPGRESRGQVKAFTF